MIRDVELAEEALSKTAGGSQGSGRCLCLSLFSFLLVAGGTTLFCLLHFGVIGPQREEVSPWPASARSFTQREMGEKRGEIWGGGKRCADGEAWGGKQWRKMGRQEETWREMREEKEGWRNRVPGTWATLSKYLSNE